MVGAQGSGKTEYCKKYFKDYTRISQDEQGRWHRKEFGKAIEGGAKYIVVDKTNPSVEQRDRYISKAKQAGYKIIIVWMDIPRNICYKRIIERTDHPTLLPEKANEALSIFYNKFEPPTRKEAEVIKRRE